MRILFVCAIAVAIAVPTLHGQTPGDSAGVVFTELSIKPSQTLETSFAASDSARRYVVRSGTALGLIRGAYATSTIRDVVGAPAWASTDRFDIRASWSAPFAGSMEAMLRTLLAQRFGFAGHYESIEAPAFAVTVASRDGSLGPRLRAVDVVCPSGPGAFLDPRSETPPLCGFRSKRSADGAGIHMTANGVTMAQLARMFSVDGHPLVDRTGLTGRFRFELDYRRPYKLETAPDGTLALVPSTDPAPGHIDLPVALFEQLGLGLEPITIPSQVFVVDRMQRPITD